MKIQGVIFDLDGVLTATDKLHTKAWEDTCRRWGISFSTDTGEMLRGVSRGESVQIILDKAGYTLPKEEQETFAHQKNEYYVHSLALLSEKDVLPGVHDTINRLKQENILIAVASSSKNARRILAQIRLEGEFPVIIEGTQIQKSKPDPEVFQKAADALHLPPEACLVVEDAISGIEAARCLGCRTAGLGKEGKESFADYKIDRVDEILALLGY